MQEEYTVRPRGTGRLLFVFHFVLLFLFWGGIASSKEPDVKQKQVVLVDFEKGIPSSHEGDVIGFRRQDKERGRIVEEGAEASTRSGVFRVAPEHKDIYIQGDVRRKYLLTRSERYVEDGPNALSFWLKLPAESSLIGRVQRIKVGARVIGKKTVDQPTLGVWSYHWRYGDLGVGGKDNRSLATDSMMHAYSNLRFNEGAAGKWVKVVLSASAFQQSRNYFHFYAARGSTDDLDFFGSLRQLQFRVLAKLEKEEDFQIDEVKLVHQPPTAVFEKDFFKGKVSRVTEDVSIPVTIKNPTDKDRGYRVFISSFLGVEREIMNKVVSLTDDIKPAGGMQHAVRGDGGTGAVELVSEEGKPIGREISIPAGGVWNGKVVHHIKPEMLGKEVVVKTHGYEFSVRRDTLTTSVIVWDPEDVSTKEMDYVEVGPSNSDDGNHPAPPGFPRQRRPPRGWRSEDIPVNQVGGYFVSVLSLSDR